jgi:PIN like domain
MRVLLDECLPQRLRNELDEFDVSTVTEMGWSGKKNGELLELMAAQHFQIFLTADQNVRYQQNLVSVDVAIIVLVAPTNRLADLIPLMNSARIAMNSAEKGEILEITS